MDWASLPNDIKFLILSHLIEPVDLVHLAQASPEFAETVRQIPAEDWTRILKKDGLFGDSLEDCIKHVTLWNGYRERLIQALDEHVTYNRTTHQTLLKNHIWGFTKYLTKHEDWHNRLSIGYGRYFLQFRLDLTAGLRFHQGKWGKPTLHSNDRGNVGFFAYSVLSKDEMEQGSYSVQVTDDRTNVRIKLPLCACAKPLPVTALIHKGSLLLYSNILIRAIESNATTIVESIQEEHPKQRQLQQLSPDWRNKNHLPEAAADKLKRISTELGTIADLQELRIDEAQRLRSLAASINWQSYDIPRCPEVWAMTVAREQREREHESIVTALWELALSVFGPERVPVLEDVLDGYKI